MKHILLRLLVLFLVFQCLLFTGIPAFGLELNPQATGHTEVERLIAMAKAQRNSELAVEYAENAIAIADSLNDPIIRARAYQISGISWRAAGDYLMAEKRLQVAFGLFSATGDDHEAHKVKRDLGETFRAGGAFSSFDTSGIEGEALEVKRELGETFRAAGVFDQAMRLFYEAKAHFSEAGDSLELARTLNRMAATAYEMTYTHPAYKSLMESIEPSDSAFSEGLPAHPELIRMLDQAKAYLNSALTMARELNDHALIISNEIIQAAIYGMECKTTMTIQKYDEIIEYMMETGHTGALPLAMINKARHVGEGWLNQFDDAIELLQEALQMAKSTNTTIYVVMAHQLLHDNYLALGDYKSAYYHFVMNAKFIFQQQGTLLMLKTNAKEYEYQIIQREAEISHSQRLFRTTAIMGGSIVLAFSLFLIILGIKNREKWRLLEQLNNNSLVIQRQNKELSQAISSKDRLFSIIGHDLRNPFQTILGFSELLNENIHRYDKTKVQKFARQINTATEQTLHLLNNLLHWAQLQRNQVRHLPERLNLTSVLEDILTFGYGLSEEKNIHIDNRVPSDLMVMADVEMLKTILRNLVGNAVKFTKPGGRITLTAQPQPDEIIVCVEDNGIGMNKDQISNLFSSSTVVSKPGTSNEEGTGLGLMLCKEFVEMQGGKIWVESTEGEGSRIFFSIPNA